MDSKKLNIGLAILKWIIILVGGGSLVAVMMHGGDTDVESVRQEIDGRLNPAFLVVYITAILAGAVAVGFGLYFMVTNIKKSIPMLVGIVVFGLVLLISWLSAGDETLRAYGTEITSGVSQYAGAGINMVYILGAGAIIAIVASEVSKILK